MSPLSHIFQSLYGISLQLEKVMGQPDLPEDPDALREAFNGALIHFATLKPPTNPDIQTSRYSSDNCGS